eukprot:365072-Chlamydomonas_euryale.AAC.10
MRLGLPSFIVSSRNGAVSKTQSLSQKVSAIGDALPLCTFELQQQPSYLLNATPSMHADAHDVQTSSATRFGKGVGHVLKPLAGWPATPEVGQPPFSVDHRNGPHKSSLRFTA